MIWLLLIVYQIKHWVADYPLQGRYMLGKFGVWPKWVLPLLAHASVHGLATFLIALCVRPDIALYLALFDFSTHFIVDRIKASPTLGGRYKPMNKAEMEEALKVVMVLPGSFDKSPYKPGGDSDDGWQFFKAKIKSNTYFWWALGLDQMAHHMTHYIIIWQLVR